MTDADPRREVDTLRKRLRGNHPKNDPQVPFEADRHHLHKMVENMRLMQSEVGDHRQLKFLRHCRRMAILAEWPTVRDFEENGEADETVRQIEAEGGSAIAVDIDVTDAEHVSEAYGRPPSGSVPSAVS